MWLAKITYNKGRSSEGAHYLSGVCSIKSLQGGEQVGHTWSLSHPNVIIHNSVITEAISFFNEVFSLNICAFQSALHSQLITWCVGI